MELYLYLREKMSEQEKEHLQYLQNTEKIKVIELETEKEAGEVEMDLPGMDAVYVSDDLHFLKRKKEEGAAVIAYLDDAYKTGEDIAEEKLSIRYAVDDLLALDGSYLKMAYCRAKKIPKVIAETDRLIIRELTIADLDALLDIFDQNEKTPFFQAFYDNRDEAEVYLKSYIENVYDFYGYGIWGICLKSDRSAAPEDNIQNPGIIGIIGFTERDEDGTCLEMGYALAKSCQGQGYVAETSRIVVKYAKEILGFQKIIKIVKDGKIEL